MIQIPLGARSDHGIEVKATKLSFWNLPACTEFLLPGQNPIQPWILTLAPISGSTSEKIQKFWARIWKNFSLRIFLRCPRHWCRLAHTRCRQVTTIGGGWGPAMSSIATILPGTPGPSCDSQALGGAQSQTKQIYDEVQWAQRWSRTLYGKMVFQAQHNVLHNGLINMMLNTEYQQ